MLSSDWFGDATVESTAALLYENYTTTTTTAAPMVTTNGNVAALCGARFCPGVTASEIPNLTPPSPSKIYLLSGVFLALMVCACALVASGADSLRRYEMGRKGAGSGLSGCRLLAVTLRHLGQRKQLLLLPITMFIGAEEAFIAVDFTAVSVYNVQLRPVKTTSRLNNFFFVFRFPGTVVRGLRLGNFENWLRHDLLWHCQYVGSHSGWWPNQMGRTAASAPGHDGIACWAAGVDGPVGGG